MKVSELLDATNHCLNQTDWETIYSHKWFHLVPVHSCSLHGKSDLDTFIEMAILKQERSGHGSSLTVTNEHGDWLVGRGVLGEVGLGSIMTKPRFNPQTNQAYIKRVILDGQYSRSVLYELHVYCPKQP